jgi:hypothetical protein
VDSNQLQAEQEGENPARMTPLLLRIPRNAIMIRAQKFLTAQARRDVFQRRLFPELPSRVTT